MALDRHKTRKNAEHLLQQGKLDAALDEFQRLAEDSPRDLPLLNAVGDLLGRMGRGADAIQYYEKVVAEYIRSGFFPRAVAILKKVLRLRRDDPVVMARLADLYAKQQLIGEARAYYLLAADRHVQARAFAQAKEIYQKLVAVEPGDMLHRVRLAETIAAGGDAKEAGETFLALAETLRQSRRTAEAEKIYRRAAELLPARPEPVAGVAACLVQQGRPNEAIGLLEDALSRPGAGVQPARDLLALYAAAGRTGDCFRLLVGPRGEALHDDDYERVLQGCIESGTVEQAWVALDPLFERWSETGRGDRLDGLLLRLSRLETQGHIPSLQRLWESRRARGDRQGMIRALELLIAAYRTRSMDDEASLMMEKLEEIAPRSVVARAPRERGAEGAGQESPRDAAPDAQAAAATAAPEQAREATGEPPADQTGALAIPHDPLDEEFVAGRLTQAEIFEKYGLLNQAVDQLREVTSRFPGLVSAHMRLAGLLRARGDVAGLSEVLVQLAAGLKATGDMDRAEDAARDAIRAAPNPEEARQRLAGLGICPAAEVEVAAVQGVVAGEPVPAAAAAPPAPATAEQTDQGEVEIAFDEAAVPAQPEPEIHEAAVPQAPPPEEIEEIVFYLDQGMVSDASRLLKALRGRGYSGATLDRLEARIIQAGPSGDESIVETVEEGSASEAGSCLDEDDLRSIAKALQEARPETDLETLAAAPNVTEQSLEDVLDTFRQHVDQEIGQEDFRTHYDLGIGYKEMGLLEDAVAAFQTAARSPALFHDACSMIALCHRERGDLQGAAEWYRQAIGAPGSEARALLGLQYDLAEVLLASGEEQEALDLFRRILQVDPSYRDVTARVSEIESRLRS